MHADLVNCRSSRCDRIRRICEDETTICLGLCIRRNLFRLARPLRWYRPSRTS